MDSYSQFLQCLTTHQKLLAETSQDRSYSVVCCKSQICKTKLPHKINFQTTKAEHSCQCTIINTFLHCTPWCGVASTALARPPAPFYLPHPSLVAAARYRLPHHANVFPKLYPNLGHYQDKPIYPAKE